MKQRSTPILFHLIFFFALMFASITQAGAQQLMLSEDFSTFPANINSGGYKGWTNATLVGNSSYDYVYFNNPPSYSIGAPMAGITALFDSYNAGTGGPINDNSPETIVLTSPTISTVGKNNLGLSFDNFFLQLGSVTVSVEVSTNGSTWTTVYASSSGMGLPANTVINLNGYIGQPTFSFRFKWTQPNFQNNNGYWQIDNVKLYTNLPVDVAPTDVVNPKDLICPSSSQQLGIRVSNPGTTTASNVPVSLTITGGASGSYSTTISSIAPGSYVDVFTSTFINTNAGGAITFKVITTLSGDQVGSNDTFIKVVNIAPAPTDPGSAQINQCGAGPVNLTCASATGETTLWYETNSATTPLGSGNPFKTPYSVSGSRSFYAENASVLKNSLSTTLNGPWRVNISGTTHGTFFDINTFNEVIVDSFDVNFAYAGTYTVEVFYKTGTYSGFESNKSAWTSLGTASVTSLGLGRATKVRIGNLLIPAGQTRGILITASGGSIASFAWKNTLNTYQNSDMSIYGQSVTYDCFNVSLCCYEWDGNVYYRKTCKSSRKAIPVNIINRPAGVSFSKSTPFKGLLKTGDAFLPDAVKLNDTIVYEFNPPSTFTNANYNTGWVITGYTVKTIGGALLTSSSDTVTSKPGAGNAKIWFRPSGNLDSVVKISIKVLDIAKACDTTVDRYVKIAGIPSANFPTTNVCFGDYTVFTNSSSVSGLGTLSYKWYFGNGDSSNLAEPVYKYATPGNYTVRLIVTSGDGFQDSISKTIGVYNIPAANFKFVNACEGAPVTFADNSTLPSGTAVYDWDFGDGSTHATTATTSRQYASAGYYQVKLSVTVNGCSNTISKYVTQAPRSVPKFTPSAPLCDNKSITFDASGTTAPAFGSVGYTWDFGDMKSGTTSPVEHTYSAFGSYTAKLIAITDLGCRDSVSHPVSLKEAPVPSFTTSGGTCSNQDVNFTNTSSGPGNSYTWMFGDGQTSGDANPSHKYSGYGPFTITLKATAGNGCEGSKDFSITIDETPVADFEGMDVCLGKETKFKNNSTANDPNTITYTWDLDGTPSSQTDPSMTFATSGTKTIKLKAAIGACSDEVTKTVNIGKLPGTGISYTSNHSGDNQIKFHADEGTPGTKYLWRFGDGGTSTLQDPVYKFSYNGWRCISLTVTSADGCEDKGDTCLTANALGIAGVNSSNGLSVYPNPSAGMFNVVASTQLNSDVTITVSDILGKSVKQWNGVKLTMTEAAQLDMTDLKAGTYTINISNAEVNETVKVIIVR